MFLLIKGGPIPPGVRKTPPPSPIPTPTRDENPRQEWHARSSKSYRLARVPFPSHGSVPSLSRALATAAGTTAGAASKLDAHLRLPHAL